MDKNTKSSLRYCQREREREREREHTYIYRNENLKDCLLKERTHIISKLGDSVLISLLISLFI